MLNIFAHAGETHATVAEETSHLLLTDWFIALPLLLVLMIVIGRLTYALSKSPSVTYIVVSAGLLVAGVGLYQLSPVTSTVALACGFCLILLQVLTDLRRPPSSKK